MKKFLFYLVTVTLVLTGLLRFSIEFETPQNIAMRQFAGLILNQQDLPQSDSLPFSKLGNMVTGEFKVRNRSAKLMPSNRSPPLILANCIKSTRRAQPGPGLRRRGQPDVPAALPLCERNDDGSEKTRRSRP